MPNHDQIYQQQAGNYEKLISRQPSLAGIIHEIRPFRNLDIIDLGAGSGRLTAVLANEANSIRATDESRAMLDELELKLKQAGRSNYSTVVADHRNLPYEPSSADLVVAGWSLCYLASSNVIDWQSNIRLMMSEIERILKPNGTLILFETLGTGYETPHPPDFLTSYYCLLEEQYGFSNIWIRTDYTFEDLEEAEELTRFFFGDPFAAKVVEENWVVVPECAGVWWKHLTPV